MVLFLPIDSGLGVCGQIKKAGTLPTLQSLWTGPTPIDVPAYMHDAKNGIETYQTGIVHLV